MVVAGDVEERVEADDRVETLGLEGLLHDVAHEEAPLRQALAGGRHLPGETRRSR